MEDTDLESIAYNSVTWWQIMDDVNEYNSVPDAIEKHGVRLRVSEFKSLDDVFSKAVPERDAQLEKVVREHNLMYFHMGYRTISEAINALPVKLKRELRLFAKDFAKVVHQMSADLKNWDEISIDGKLALMQAVTDKFVLSCRKKFHISVSFNEDDSRSASQGEKVFICKAHLNKSLAEAFGILCHELNHSFSTLIQMPRKVSCPADVINALNRAGIGYIYPEEDYELYTLQIAELTVRATQAYFLIELERLQKANAPRPSYHHSRIQPAAAPGALRHSP